MDGGGDWVEGWGKQGGACGDMGVVHLPYTPVCQVERGEKDCLGLTLSPRETEREGEVGSKNMPVLPNQQSIITISYQNKISPHLVGRGHGECWRDVGFARAHLKR